MLPIKITKPAQVKEEISQFPLSLRGKTYYRSTSNKECIYTTLLSFRKIDILPTKLISYIFEQGVPPYFDGTLKSLFKGFDLEDPDLENKLKARCVECNINYDAQKAALAEVKTHFLAQDIDRSYFEKQFGNTAAKQFLSIVNHLNMLPTQAKTDETLKGSMHANFVETWEMIENISTDNTRLYLFNENTHFYLFNKNLFYVPNNLKKCTTLTNLDLSINHLMTLPPKIEKLTKLQSLSIGDNQLSNLPESIGNLAMLTVLMLFRNQLKTLPNSITQLSNGCTIVVEPSVQVPDGCEHLDIRREDVHIMKFN